MSKYLSKMTELGFYFVREESRQTSLERIQQVEREIGQNFSSDYTDFLLYFGVIGFENYVDFPVLEPCSKGEIMSVSCFFGILPGESYDLVVEYETYRDQIPIDAFPIANDACGNVICIQNYGNIEKVYFWDHEDYSAHDPEKSSGYSNVYLLANSFDEFINSLYCADDDE
jgi:SMI1-KNR4 cell-wall